MIFLGRFRVIFVHFVPCLSLVLLNFLLCAALRRADQRRQRWVMGGINSDQITTKEIEKSINKVVQ